MVPRDSTVKEVSLEWLHCNILWTDLKNRRIIHAKHKELLESTDQQYFCNTRQGYSG